CGLRSLFPGFLGFLRVHHENRSFGGFAFPHFLFFFFSLVEFFVVSCAAENVGLIRKVNGALLLGFLHWFRDRFAGRLIHGLAAGGARLLQTAPHALVFA